MQVERGQPRLPGFDEEELPEPTHPAAAILFETPVEICRRVFRDVRPRTPFPEFSVEFCRFANANSFIRSENGRLELRITDALEAAPAPILEALAYILICKLFRKPVPPAQRHRYNLYLNRQDVRRSLHLLRQTRGRKHISGPAGERFNLQEIFNELNERAEPYGKPFRLVQDVTILGSQEAQKQLSGKESISLTGSLEYQACDDARCLPAVTRMVRLG